MARSVWKPQFVHYQVIDELDSPRIHVQNRATMLTPSRVGRHFNVYNGARWFQVEVTQEKLRHRLGEFAPTRKRPIPKKKKVIKKKTTKKLFI